MSALASKMCRSLLVLLLLLSGYFEISSQKRVSYTQKQSSRGELNKYLNPLRVRGGAHHLMEWNASSEVSQKVYTTSKGINALLITDESMLESAFSIGVGCGYYQDPEDIPGLAHLMEHVTFLGSEDDPNPIGWDEFLLKKGGFSNAYTTADSTVFYTLTIPRELESVISYFVKMLVKPIIDENSSVSEIDAVNQEHEKNIPNKIRMMIELALHLSPEECPARKFGTGNKETLYTNPIKNNIDLRKALLDFHKKCYVSGNISLVIIGPQSEAELIKIVDHIDTLFPSNEGLLEKSSSFSGKNRTSRQRSQNPHIDLSPITDHKYDIFSSIQIGVGSGHSNRESNIDITPVGNVERLKINKENDQKENNQNSFTVELIKVPKGDSSPPLIIFYWDSLDNSLDIIRNNAEWQMLKLIQYYFEDQGPNSMYNRLQQNKLVSNLEYFDNTSSKYSIYGLLLTATDDSDDTTLKIANIVSDYMNNLIEKVISSEDDKWIHSFYKNYSSMANIEYMYDENRNTALTISQAAENILLFPDEPEMALSAFVKPYNLTEARELSSDKMNFLKVFFESLKPEKMKIIKLTDSDYNNDKSDLKQYFEPYKVNYSLSKLNVSTEINSKIRQKEQEDTGVEEFSNISELLSCVPENLEIIKSANNECPKYEDNGKEILGNEIKDPFIPCPLLLEEGTSIYWKGPIHKTPTINITLIQRLKNEDIENNTRRALIAKIHAIIQSNRITSSLSSKILCGLETNITFNRGRFVFNLQYYSSDFGDLIKEIKNSVANWKNIPTELEFDNALNHLKSQVLNLNEALAFDIASDIAYSVYLSNYYSQIELRDTLLGSEIKYSEYLEGLKEDGFLSTGYIDSLVIGNVSPQDAIEYSKELQSSFIFKSVPLSETARDGILELQKDVHISIQNPISGDKNNAVVVHYVTPPVDLIDASVYYSISEMINSQFYDIIRTEWQDGYVAFASMKYKTPIMSLIAGVQTAEKEPDTLKCHLFSAFDLIFKNIKEDLSKSSKSEFENRTRWFGLSEFSTHTLDSFSKYVVYMSNLIISREMCFEKNRLTEDATKIFISNPSVYIDKLKNLITNSSNERRIVLVELVGNEDSTEETEDEHKLNRILNSIEPPSNQECINLINNRLANSVDIKLEEDKDRKLRGSKKKSEPLSHKNHDKYILYDQSKQCNVSQENAIVASGKTSKEVESLLSMFSKSASLNKKINSNARFFDINNKSKHIKKMCSQS